MLLILQGNGKTFLPFFIQLQVDGQGYVVEGLVVHKIFKSIIFVYNDHINIDVIVVYDMNANAVPQGYHVFFLNF